MRLKLIFIIFTLLSLCTHGQKGPNILWIYVDDMSPWMGCYGDNTILTPNIDRLSKGGILFNNTYMTSAACSTTRSALITGTVQSSLGLHHHRTRLKEPLPSHILTIPEIFKNAGYITFNEAKDDYNFKKDRNEMYSEEFKRPGYQSHLPRTDLSWLKQLQGKKFFGQIQLAGGKFGGETGSKYPSKSSVDEKTIKLPPQYPNHPVFRNAFARHYEQISHTDKQVGPIIKALKKYKLYEDTIIFFFTDHGAPLPRSKQFLYEDGTKVPLIIHSPKYINELKRHGLIRNDLVSGIDISSSSLALARLAIPNHIEGQDLFKPDLVARTHLISARDRCGNAIDHVRAVRTEKYRYIRNYKTDRALYQPNYRNNYASFKTLRDLYEKGQLSPIQASYLDAKQRPSDELYDLEKDPHQINNLAKNPEYKEILLEHQKILKTWEEESDDQGRYPESAARLRNVLRTLKKRCINPEYESLKTR